MLMTYTHNYKMNLLRTIKQIHCSYKVAAVKKIIKPDIAPLIELDAPATPKVFFKYLKIKSYKCFYNKRRLSHF